MGISVRQVSTADSVRVAELVSALGYPTSTAQMQARLEAILPDADYVTLVACEEAHVVGFIGARWVASMRATAGMARSWPWRLRRTISITESAACSCRRLNRC